jgi:ERCC4-type nuclease
LITIDRRIGSADILNHMPPGVAELGDLEYGDAMFVGNGQDDEAWLIGIERKTISDLLNCIASGRLSGHQLIGMNNSYHQSYIVVEGLYRPNPKDGILEVYKFGKWLPLDLGKRRFMVRDVVAFIQTLQIVAGVVVWHTANLSETANYIVGLHHWWTSKAFEEHHSHMMPHTGVTVELYKHSFVRRVASQLEGVGWNRRAKAIDGVFQSVVDMALADEEQWRDIEGIGKKLAVSITKQFRGEGK